MSSNLDELFGSNESLEKGGSWVEVGNGVSFKIKRFGGLNQSEVKKSYAKFYKPVANLVEKDLLPDEKEREVLTKVWVHSCLVDWKGVEVDGKEIEFSKEAAIKLLVKLPDLLDTLMSFSQEKDNFKEIVGN